MQMTLASWKKASPLNFRLGSLRLLLCRRFLITRQRRVAGALPGTLEIEAAKFLRQFYGLVDNALLLLAIADFNETCQRKVLAQREASKTIVRKDAAQVGMSFEKDAVKIVSLALVPVRRREYVYEARNG